MLLHIDSSPLYGRSVSRELTASFVAQLKSSHPDGRVGDREASLAPHLAQAQGNELTALVQLYLALGGGWQ
jgi:FMN-dependent NADH-azoreductase